MRHRIPSLRNSTIYTIAVVGFISTIHYVLPVYYSSSFLSTFTSEKMVGIIYMLGSVMTILGFLIIPTILRKLGNYVTALWLIIIQMILFYGLISTLDVRFIAIFFILQIAVISLIIFCLDVFLEVSSDKAHIGGIRGMYLTTINSAWIIAPLIGSMILGTTNNYHNVYIASLFMLFPLFYLVYRNFKNFKDPHYGHLSFLENIKLIRKKKDYARLFFINIILNTFYSWMVVYSPIYLNKVIGLSWSSIGIIITVMLIPFPIIEWPLGKLADRKYGEKEIMIMSFALLGLSTIALAIITSHSVFIWAIALFITRIGAAGAEIMVETYFFKTVRAEEPGLLGFFRITRSLSYFIAPLITGFGLIFFRDQSVLFIFLGILCLLAIIPAWKIRDTN